MDDSRGDREKEEQCLLSLVVAPSWLPDLSVTQSDICPARHPANNCNMAASCPQAPGLRLRAVHAD